MNRQIQDCISDYCEHRIDYNQHELSKKQYKQNLKMVKLRWVRQDGLRENKFMIVL